MKIFNPEIMTDGFNSGVSGEEVFFISNPATGLWAAEERLIK